MPFNPYYQPEVSRPYTKESVDRIRGPVHEECTLAKEGASQLRLNLRDNPVRALGAQTGAQAVQMVRAGLKGVYVSGWQVAADANSSSETYPDQSLYPVDSVPKLVRRINSALIRAGQIEGRKMTVPLVADAEAGFGGPLNAFELTKALIKAGAAGVHLEDQLSSEKKCGHLGGKVLIPTQHAIRNLVAARLAADVCKVDTVIIARTDADSAKLITSDIDSEDRSFIETALDHYGDEQCTRVGINPTAPMRTPEGFYTLKGRGINRAIARGLSYAPYADMLWMETSTPDLDEAKEFAEAIHQFYPDRLLAYNCSPSFNWSGKMGSKEILSFQTNLAEMGYAFQFVTLAGFHAINYSMFDLAYKYARTGMLAYRDLQDEEFESEEIRKYTAVKHQREVGTAYFDEITQAISGGHSSTTAMEGSTEKDQFK